MVSSLYLELLKKQFIKGAFYSIIRSTEKVFLRFLTTHKSLETPSTFPTFPVLPTKGASDINFKGNTCYSTKSHNSVLYQSEEVIP